MRSIWLTIFIGVVAFGGGMATTWSSDERSTKGRTDEDTVAKNHGLPDVDELLEDLGSGDSNAKVAAYQSLVRFHDELTAGLLHQARNGPDVISVELLRRYYSPDVFPLLIEHVDAFEPRRMAKMSTVNGYPCAQALARFRQQSSAAVLEYLWKTRSEEISDKANELYAWVFLAAYGGGSTSIAGGLEEAIGVVERARDRATHGKENCQRLLDELKKLRKKSST